MQSIQVLLDDTWQAMVGYLTTWEENRLLVWPGNDVSNHYRQKPFRVQALVDLGGRTERCEFALTGHHERFAFTRAVGTPAEAVVNVWWDGRSQAASGFVLKVPGAPLRVRYHPPSLMIVYQEGENGRVRDWRVDLDEEGVGYDQQFWYEPLSMCRELVPQETFLRWTKLLQLMKKGSKLVHYRLLDLPQDYHSASEHEEGEYWTQNTRL